MLVLVVGPSGAGKDTLLGLVRQALCGEPKFRFVRRVITRPAAAGGEDHEPVSEAEFQNRAFVLQWSAHGLRYGLPADVADDLARNVVVVANVSRGVIAEAAARFPTRVIEITASPALLAQRLAARGRETAIEVALRLARSVALPHDVPVHTVINDATAAQGADCFISILRSL